MKKIIAVLAALVTLVTTFALAAPAQATTPEWSRKDKAFVRLVRADAPYFKNTPVRYMIEAAHSTCDLLDTGYAETDSVQMMIDTGFTENQSLVFISAAMTVYCPWHGDDLRAKPADLDDVRYMTSLGRVAFMDISFDSQNAICLWFEIEPYAARNEMARGWYNNVFEGEYSMYDTRRAAWRLLNWAC